MDENFYQAVSAGQIQPHTPEQMAFFRKLFGVKEDGGGAAAAIPGVGGDAAAPAVGGGSAEMDAEAEAGGGGDDFDESCLYSFKRTAKGVDKQSFELIRVLGKGSFGKVMLVRYKEDGQLYAMKVLKKDMLIARRQVEHTKAERNILRSMTGIPFIVSMKFAFQTPEKLYLILDFCQGGELFFHLKAKGRFSEQEVRFYASQMVCALEEIHRRDVVYRDLKPENVLLDSDGYICLTDFGLSKENIGSDTEGTSTFCGTPEYLAPEQLHASAVHGKGVDWWSLGTLLYEMRHGLPPFYSTNTSQMYEKIAKEELKLPRHFSPELGNLLEGLLQRDPAARFNAEQIKAHPFFAGLEWDKLMARQYEPPFVPQLAGELDLSYFDRQFTRELPYDSEQEATRMGSVSGGMFEGFTFDEAAAESMLAREDEQMGAMGADDMGSWRNRSTRPLREGDDDMDELSGNMESL